MNLLEFFESTAIAPLVIFDVFVLEHEYLTFFYIEHPYVLNINGQIVFNNKTCEQHFSLCNKLTIISGFSVTKNHEREQDAVRFKADPAAICF